MNQHDGHEDLQRAFMPLGIQFLVKTGAGFRGEVSAMYRRGRNGHDLRLRDTKNCGKPQIGIAETSHSERIRSNSSFILGVSIHSVYGSCHSSKTVRQRPQPRSSPKKAIDALLSHDQDIATWEALRSDAFASTEFHFMPGGYQHMSESQVIANQKRILANQKTIMANQSQIKANQETIKRNQATILKNQGSLKMIISNQKRILAAVGK
jgi:hypothetical protein